MTSISSHPPPSTGDSAAGAQRAWSRRAFLGAGVGGAAYLGLSPQASAQQGYVKRKVPIDATYTLVNRITQGFNLAELRLARQMGYEPYLEYQLDYQNIDDSATQATVATRYPTLSLSGKRLYEDYVLQGGAAAVIPYFDLKKAMAFRSVYSKRQLFERMVEFWTDHFNIHHDDDINFYLKTIDDRSVIRRHALGKFPDLLRASAHSGPMLVYLDNNTNIKNKPQENYARELMELHTLGVTGPYTEADVKEVSRCLTGWTLESFVSFNHGQFRFNFNQHDQSPKVVLGVNIPANGGQQDGETVLDILVNHPATANYIALKMCRWFLSYDPPEEVVKKTAKTYMRTGGDIKEMLRVILSPWSMSKAEAWYQNKLKRPYHFMISLLRAANVGTANFTQLNFQLFILGQMPFNWQTPDGYPDVLDYWGPAVYPRWRFASDLFLNRIPGTFVEMQSLFGPVGGMDPQRLPEQINMIMAGGRMPEEEVEEIRAYLNGRTLTTTTIFEGFALAASAPSFQFY